MTRNERIKRLIENIPELSDYRLELIDRIVCDFFRPWEVSCTPNSDLISNDSLLDFGDILRIHHGLSREPFSKDKFEFALEAILQNSGKRANLAPRGTRGYDIEIANQKVSLKTEAAAVISPEKLHISKFMELGGGQWGSNPDDLVGLREQFFNNLSGIDRILVLRALKKGSPNYLYELVEIPKNLLELVKRGRLEMRLNSKQVPKPGYCYVEQDGKLLYSLYFDGGGERKLQIKGLRKELCFVHATWQFSVTS